jgi:hypothetical protein
MLPARPSAQLVHREQCLDQAARCRRLAHAITDRQAADALLALARDYERDAWEIQPRFDLAPQALQQMPPH